MLRFEKVKTAFVATNSITQGVQPCLLWKPLFAFGTCISFAYRTFKWQNKPGDGLVLQAGGNKQGGKYAGIFARIMPQQVCIGCRDRGPLREIFRKAQDNPVQYFLPGLFFPAQGDKFLSCGLMTQSLAGCRLSEFPVFKQTNPSVKIQPGQEILMKADPALKSGQLFLKAGAFNNLPD